MNISYPSVDAYIKSFDESHQPKLQELRQLILEIAPEGTKEIISYGMPTFRWQGNLIHFAQAKRHIGLYPGPDVIVAMQEDLKNYTTAKGTIQLPLEGPLPRKLIQDIVRYNVSLLNDKFKRKK